MELVGLSVGNAVQTDSKVIVSHTYFSLMFYWISIFSELFCCRYGLRTLKMWIRMRCQLAHVQRTNFPCKSLEMTSTGVRTVMLLIYPRESILLTSTLPLRSLIKLRMVRPLRVYIFLSWEPWELLEGTYPSAFLMEEGQWRKLFVCSLHSGPSHLLQKSNTHRGWSLWGFRPEKAGFLGSYARTLRRHLLTGWGRCLYSTSFPSSDSYPHSE